MVDCRKKKYKKTCKNKKKKKVVKHTSKSYKKKQSQKKGRVSQTQSLVVHVHPKKTTRRRTTNKPKVNPYQQQMNMRNFGMAQQFLYQSQMNSRPKASVNSYYQEQINKLNKELNKERNINDEIVSMYNEKYGNIAKKIKHHEDIKKEDIKNFNKKSEQIVEKIEEFRNDIEEEIKEKYTIEGLKKLLRDNDIKGYSKKNKNKLIKMVIENGLN